MPMCTDACFISTLRHASTVAVGQCWRTSKTDVRHYTVILLQHLAPVIDVLRHSCGHVDWQLTELNPICSKNFNNFTRNSVLRSLEGLNAVGPRRLVCCVVCLFNAPRLVFTSLPIHAGLELVHICVWICTQWPPDHKSGSLPHAGN